MDSAAYVFPAVRGTQAQREYYISMVPLDVMSKIFQFADEDLPPEIRAQRILNKSRIPEIRDYILSNPDSYVFSALTVSVDGNMEFMPADEMMPQVGAISISMTSRFLINDGQHRRAAIAEAIKMNPSLKNEHISVVFYRDEGLLRSQQMFSDLNRYAIKPTKSINILFNSREESSIIAKRVIDEVGVFKGLVEKDGNELLKSQLSAGEQQMFAVAIVWALALTSGYKAPVIIDTPMARLDSSHRANFVTKYLPAASSQVMVLSTDEEVYGRYLDLVRDNVVDYYTLLYREEEQCTSIVHGYFGEV